VLLVGLVGFGVTMLVFSFAESLATVYAERFLSGMFAAAVTPVAAAVIGNFTTTEQGRARRFAFVSMLSLKLPHLLLPRNLRVSASTGEAR
jgi:MFS family permease